MKISGENFDYIVSASGVDMKKLTLKQRLQWEAFNPEGWNKQLTNSLDTLYDVATKVGRGGTYASLVFRSEFDYKEMSRLLRRTRVSGREFRAWRNMAYNTLHNTHLMIEECKRETAA